MKDTNGIVLDSFVGSGSTGHAVLNLSTINGDNRKFILIEFDYYELGQPLYTGNGDLNEEVGSDKIRNYVYYTETKAPLKPSDHKDNKYFLDKFNDTSYYFYYEPDSLTTLNHEF
jgi:adenine-specific DNA-methyltransferase